MNLITILTENMIRFRTKNITPANLKTILDKSPIVINESVIKNSLLTEGVSEGMRCWYYNQLAKKTYITDKRVPNPSNASGVQDFLIAIGYNIKSDGSFGDETAKALATWRYGASAGIDTVDKFWSKLKSDGYNVGTTSGYGPSMKSGVASMIIATCITLAKSCVIDAQSLFKMDFATWPREVADQLESSFIAAIKYWKDYLNNVNVQKKISINLYGSINMPNMIKTQQDIIPRYIAILDKIKETGWAADSTNSNADRFMMYVASNDTLKVRVNMHYYNKMYKEHGIIKMGIRAKNTFVHEIQHSLFRVAKATNYVKSINPAANIKLAFPLGYDALDPSATASKQLVQSQISQSSKNDLTANGIDYNKLIAHYNTEYWKKGDTCHESELISRLESYREYLTDRKVIQMGGTILLTTISSDIKKIINGQAYGDELWDFRQMIGCWVLGGMTPKLTDFVNKLNALAKNSIQDKNNVNFKQMDQDERT